MMRKNGFHERFRNLQQVHREVAFNFIVAELGVALTFFNIGQTTTDEQRAARTLARAKRAYGRATHFLENARLSSAEALIIFEKMERLEPLLATAGTGQIRKAEPITDLDDMPLR